MASLAREVAFGATSAFKSQSDFTAPDSSAQRGLGSSEPAASGWLCRPNGAHATPLDAHRADGNTTSTESKPLLLCKAGQSDDDGDKVDGMESTTALGEDKALQTFSRRVRIGINASWAVNITLLIVKVVAFALSLSYSVLASAVDSLVDLLSQGLLAVAEHQAATFDARYPIGRTRMADLSVIGCAVVMFVSTALVIREAVAALWQGTHGRIPSLDVGALMYTILGVATAAKLLLWLYCRTLAKNPIMVALAQDHLNDVMSNVAAMAGAGVAYNYPAVWWADPAMALLFSALIIRNWVFIVKEQVEHIVGLGAPEDLTESVIEATKAHHPDLKLDRVTAYHHGAHYVVEVEVVLPADMTVRESHDIALTLQHKVEALESVERAFVHVDYCTRSMDEHKVERNLKLGEKDVMKALTPSEAHALLQQDVQGSTGGLSPRTPRYSGNDSAQDAAPAAPDVSGPPSQARGGDVMLQHLSGATSTAGDKTKGWDAV